MARSRSPRFDSRLVGRVIGLLALLSFGEAKISVAKRSFSYEKNENECYASAKRHSTNPFKLSTAKDPPYFLSSNDRKKLLRYPGKVKENIISISHLNPALDHLNAEPIKHKDILRLFEYVRDRRYFSNITALFTDDSETGGLCVDKATKISANRYGRQSSSQEPKAFKRRLTWLYPDDGCMTRAEFMSLWAEDIFAIEPRSIHKFYLFGSLKVKTDFDEDSHTSWVYHVAPLVFSDSEGFLIMDPALNYNRPLPLEDWILMQTGGGKSIATASGCIIGFAITNRFAYNTKDACDNEVSRFSPEVALSDVYQFVRMAEWINNMLDEEWKRVSDRGRSPKKLLGNNPPWREQEKSA